MNSQFNEQELREQFERASRRLTHIVPKLLPIAAGIVVVLWLASGVYSVHPGHVGVVPMWSASNKFAALKWASAPASAFRRRP